MTNQNAVQKTEKPTTVFGMMKTYKSQIDLALPKHLTSDRMTRIVTTELRKNPDLLKCDPASLFGAVIQCCQLGLEPGSSLGHAYLIPFNNRKKGRTDVQLIIGYRGMIELARRSGQIFSISAQCWYENDDFTYSYGLSPDLRHTPAGGDRGKLKGAYAVASLEGGGYQFEVMTVGEINRIKAKSKTGNFGPWKEYYEEMSRKTVIRRLFKYLPVSIEIQRAAGVDEEGDIGKQNHASVLEGDYDVEFTPGGAPVSVLDRNTGDNQTPTMPDTNAERPVFDWANFTQEETRIEVTMKSGKVLSGIFVGVSGDEVAIRIGDNMETMKVEMVSEALAVE